MRKVQLTKQKDNLQPNDKHTQADINRTITLEVIKKVNKKSTVFRLTNLHDRRPLRWRFLV